MIDRAGVCETRFQLPIAESRRLRSATPDLILTGVGGCPSSQVHSRVWMGTTAVFTRGSAGRASHSWAFQSARGAEVARKLLRCAQTRCRPPHGAHQTHAEGILLDACLRPQHPIWHLLLLLTRSHSTLFPSKRCRGTRCGVKVQACPAPPAATSNLIACGRLDAGANVQPASAGCGCSHSSWCRSPVHLRQSC